MGKKYSKIYRDGVSIGVSCETEAARRELQERFESIPPRCAMELPDGVEILSVHIDGAPHVGLITKAALLGHQFCVPVGGFPESAIKDPA